MEVHTVSRLAWINSRKINLEIIEEGFLSYIA